MKWFKVFLCTLSLAWALVSCVPIEPREINVKEKIVWPYISPKTEVITTEHGTTDSERHYMAVKITTREKKSLNINEAISNVVVFVQECAAFFITDVEHLVDFVTSVFVEMECKFTSFVSVRSLTADLIPVEVIDLHPSEYVNYVAKALAKDDFGGSRHFDMMPSTFDLPCHVLNLEWLRYLEYLKKVLIEGIMGMCQQYTAGFIGFVEISLDAGSVILGVITGMSGALFVYVIHQLISASAHSRHKTLHADCLACSELRFMLGMTGTLEHQARVVVEGVRAVRGSVCELGEEVTEMRAYTSQKQAELMEILERGDTLIREIQTSDLILTVT